jgi:2-hydroxymuconate-semialdehyde hydrolase
VIPELAKERRVIAPDMVGLRLHRSARRRQLHMDTWVRRRSVCSMRWASSKADLVGNSFGGALALALAIRHPQRVRRLVLMGSVGVPFPITPGLDASGATRRRSRTCAA